jgi:trehalose 6-phosphate synthase
VTGSAPLLVASNRGPVTFLRREDGGLVPRRGGGGLVSALTGVAARTGALWVCTALSDADREAARAAPGGRLAPHDLDVQRGGVDAAHAVVRMLDIDARTFHRAYDAVANSTLWFVHHLLWQTPVSPVFDGAFAREWEGYASYNRAFADAVAEEAAPGARVLVQDYHLSLVPAMLRAARPDLRTAHFSHTPWAPPDYFALLPADVARALLEGLLGADHAGFLSPRWAAAFLACAEELLGARVDRDARTVRHRGRTTQVGVHPLGVDPQALRERAARADVEARRAALAEDLAGRRAVVRVDRTELSKNIVRGLLSFRELLRTHPEHVGEVVHVAFAYPSRAELPEYREYTATVLRVAEEINDEFGTDDWQPVLLQVEDDYARSLAAYRLADVLLVNPVRDGMNLVAKEGPVLAEDGCALVLSTEAGAAVEMGRDALLVNPYDVAGTAEALHRGLTMGDDERRRRCRGLVEAATALTPERWFHDQLEALA